MLSSLHPNSIHQCVLLSLFSTHMSSLFRTHKQFIHLEALHANANTSHAYLFSILPALCTSAIYLFVHDVIDSSLSWLHASQCIYSIRTFCGGTGMESRSEIRKNPTHTLLWCHSQAIPRGRLQTAKVSKQETLQKQSPSNQGPLLGRSPSVRRPGTFCGIPVAEGIVILAQALLAAANHIMLNGTV